MSPRLAAAKAPRTSSTRSEVVDSSDIARPVSRLPTQGEGRVRAGRSGLDAGTRGWERLRREQVHVVQAGAPADADRYRLDVDPSCGGDRRESADGVALASR